MKAIWKFKLETDDNQSIEMPIGAEILTIQTQNEEPYLWALVDGNAEKEIVNFSIYGTGHPINNDVGKYIGTYQLNKGSLVFHVFKDDL